MYTKMMGDYVQAEAIVPVDEYLSPSARERMLYLDEGTFDGHQYGVPYVVGNARGIWANTALLDRAGIDDLPATWEEFTDAAAKVQRDLDVAGVVMAWGNQARGMMNESFFPFLWQAGGEIFTEDGRAPPSTVRPGPRPRSSCVSCSMSAPCPDTARGSTAMTPRRCSSRVELLSPPVPPVNWGCSVRSSPSSSSSTRSPGRPGRRSWPTMPSSSPRSARTRSSARP